MFVVAIACELISYFARSTLFSQASLINSVGAAFAAILAVITGLLAKGEVIVPDSALAVIDSHETLGYLVLGTSIIFAALKFLSFSKKTDKYLVALVAAGLAGLIAVILAAHEGGELVYKYGVGVSSEGSRSEVKEKTPDTTSKPNTNDFNEK